jgi:hypothetical protein
VDGEAKAVARVAFGRRLRPEILALYVLVGGVVSLLGWGLDVRRLTDWGDDGISIQPNTCVAAALTGFSVLLLHHRRPRAARIVGGLVLLLGVTVLVQSLLGWNLGIDTLLMFDRTWGRYGVLSPGRMGPSGATCWTFLGSAVIAASYRAPRSRRAAVALALATTCISGLGLVGYLYGSSTLYSLPRVTVIAMQTASFIFCASLALITSVPEWGPMRLISSSTAGGVLSR